MGKNFWSVALAVFVGACAFGLVSYAASRAMTWYQLRQLSAATTKTS